ncbi:enoyl-CoA hydratase/isomerase family protein (plasmid) [Halobaculum sp. CBA1158]|uniref:enoyl-CoA hydratase/isomerase family protein n=1 Tax=Halobaculum sp. CBA1158 TaxID=2904243 RepID=UPI001F3742FF|nr:enoyl-CoA hydratase/isomerase family protein [Halobaculum sp. CBA1158]UIP01498.1 enoyl-CoA hydratase/isomerase family protein [Halobaculum sp. CBA1158]
MSENEFETLSWSFDDETGIARVTLDRPKAMNAIDEQMQHDMIGVFDRLEELDREADGVAVSVVIMEGAGEKAFSSGLDLNEMEGLENHDDRKLIPDLFCEATDAIESYDAPVIAKIDGLCLGGGFEFAIACDFRYASESSTFGQPEVNFGLLPGGGAAQRLSTIIGVSNAKELCMTGKQIDAEEALEYGALNEVHPGDELDDAVEEFAETLAGQPPLALRGIKDATNMTRQVGYEEALDYGGHIWVSLSQTEDFAEGMAAFAEDREPEYVGR